MQSESQTIFRLSKFILRMRDPRQINNNIKLEPRVFGCFSLTSERFYSTGTAELKFLVLPDYRTYPLNISANPVCADDEPEVDYLDNMLYFIKDHQNQLLFNYSNNNRRVNADIVTDSEVMQTLLCTPYTRRSWRILGTRYHSTIYLCMDEPVKDGTMSMMELLRQRTCSSMETALKRLLSSDTPDSWTASSSENGQLYGVFRCNIGKLSVVYKATMGVYQGKLNKTGKNKLNMFAECKVMFSQNPTEANDSKTKSLQALNWCCECSLKGVQDLYIADAKNPSQIESLEKTNIPNLIKENVNNWNYEWCMNFLQYTLQQFGNIMKLDNPNSVYQFDYDSNTSTLNYSVFRQPSEKTFISDWYRNVLENRNN